MEDLLKIDSGRLDYEWLRQANLVFKASKLEAQARKAVDELKRELDVERAQVDSSIRENPGNFGIVKITEKIIESTILQDVGVQELLADLNKARYDQNMRQALVNALEHKKRALESLVSLHGQNYFSEPRAKDDVSKEGVTRARKTKVRKGIPPKGDE